MMASIGPIGSIITIIGSIVLVLLKVWQDGQPGRTQEKRNEEIQKGREDIANGNTIAVSERLDKLCDAASTINTRDLGSDEDIKRRIDAFTGG